MGVGKIFSDATLTPCPSPASGRGETGRQQLDCLAGFHFPVFQEGGGQAFYCTAFEPDHGIDPFAHAGPLLEEPWIDHVEAAGVGRSAVDDHDLAVQSEIGADEQAANQSAGQGRPDRHASLAEPGSQFAAKKTAAADRIDQQPAFYPSPGGAENGLGHVVGTAAKIPDVELGVAGVRGGVDVGDKRSKNRLAPVEQLQPVVGKGGNAHHGADQAAEGLAFGAQHGPIDGNRSAEFLHPFFVGAVDFGRPFGPPLSQPQFAEQKVYHCAAEGKD